LGNQNFEKMKFKLIITVIFITFGHYYAFTQTDDLFRVTLLGTGSPPLESERMGPSTLVEVGSHKFLFDVGRGTSIRIVETGISLGAITELFITHLHGDHVVGLSDFWLTGYMHFSGRKGDLKMYGPVGVKKMAEGLEIAYADVIKYWGISIAEPGFEVVEISSDGVVYQEGDIKVTAFKVNHSPTTKLDPYGYKIEYNGRSVVISGDTGYSDNLIKYATGTDLLIHEIFTMDETKMSVALIKQLNISHTVPEVGAEIFNQVKSKAVVVYHLSPDSDPEKIKSIISKTYHGPLYMSHDLMSFNIGESVDLIERK